MVFIARRVVGKMCRNPPPYGCACHVVTKCICTRHDTGMRCLPLPATPARMEVLVT